MKAETPGEVADIAVDAVRDILDMPATAIHLYDEGERCLPPVAWTDRAEELVGEIPTFQPGEGIAWEVFETGEAQVYDDVSTASGRVNPDTEVRSEILLPLDGHGVLLIGSEVPDAFDETDVSLAQTLTAHVTTALDRIEREDELGRRQELFEALSETSIDGILVVDEDRDYVTWNQQFIDMWGIPEELIEDELEEEGLEWVLDRLENPDEFIERVESLYEHPHEESRDQVRLADGRVFDRYSAPVETDDGTYFGRVWFFRDITEQKERERRLRENERVLTALHDVANDLAASETTDEVCCRTVEAAEELLEFDLSVVALESNGILDVRATTEDIAPGSYDSMSTDEGLAGKTYRTGEAFLVDDVAHHEDAKPHGSFSSVLSLPIGRHGNFQAVADDPGTFDENDLRLA
jgi:PAS domain S-box-containing protein